MDENTDTVMMETEQVAFKTTVKRKKRERKATLKYAKKADQEAVESESDTESDVVVPESSVPNPALYTSELLVDQVTGRVFLGGLPKVPEHLNVALSRKRRRRRGRRGGLHARLRTHLDSPSPRHKDQLGFGNARRSRECYRWLRLVGFNTGVPFQCPRHVETSTRGCVQENLRPIPRVTSSPVNSSTLRVALCNTRSINNKTFVLNDVIYSHNLDLFFLTKTWLTHCYF
ncbi:hypothetical protein HF521_011795 [Silurus meridionalis]|uniref:Uncharacterized protein n=1 Tax=Silurus meridionalis TaxID=175797 RepID=A0A8T0AEX3_SILME|nr:hypothetical protein HF521_011795 [Silurus meridionalis]